MELSLTLYASQTAKVTKRAESSGKNRSSGAHVRRSATWSYGPFDEAWTLMEEQLGHFSIVYIERIKNVYIRIKNNLKK